MKQFNLEEYLRLKEEGKEPRIETREGQSARIICTDRKNEDGCIVALIDCGEYEAMWGFYEDGHYSRSMEDGLDLFFADLEPRYRPFKDADEFMEAQKEKGLYLYFKGACVHKIPTSINRGTIAILWDSRKVEEISFEVLLARATWTDGSPCGVKEG